jgi:hypothetical protein
MFANLGCLCVWRTDKCCAACKLDLGSDSVIPSWAILFYLVLLVLEWFRMLFAMVFPFGFLRILGQSTVKKFVSV